MEYLGFNVFSVLNAANITGLNSHMINSYKILK